MVHRPADSRLLTNLLTHEKDYAKSLKSLLSPSHALSAYAAACTPPLSNALLQVSTALGGADEALGRYADAVEECRDQLKRIKELEEDVGLVVRDREILVTRLIKASKSRKNLKSSNRDSLQLNLPVHTGTGSASTLSLSSGFSSPSPSQAQSISIPTAAPSSKLSAAQAELQACEATLAQKERALQLGRVEALREGLGARVRALMECGWIWAEVGKEALRALEVLQVTDGYTPFQDQGNRYSSSHGHGHELNDSSSSRHNQITEKPLPFPHDHAPYNHTSQSHQPDLQTYHIPPAHAISDTDPFPASSSYHQPDHRRVLPRRITEETLRRASLTDEDEDEGDADGGSSIDDPEPETDLRVVDNPRYLTPERAAPLPASSSSHRHSRFSLLGAQRRRSLSMSVGVGEPQTPERSPRKRGLLGRKGASASPKKRSSPSGGSTGAGAGAGGSGFFGSLKGLFGGGGSGSPGSPGSGSRAESMGLGLVVYEAPGSASRGAGGGGGGGGLFGRKKGREWEMRTERNLRDVERDRMGSVRLPGVRASVLEMGTETEGAGAGAGHMRMRESVGGRGRVVSDAGAGPGLGSGAGAGAGVKEKEAAPTPPEAKRKLRKGRSQASNPARKSAGRSSSVPPVVGSGSGSGGTGAGGLFAGTEIERRHLGALEPRVSSSRVPIRPMSPVRLTAQEPQLQPLQQQQQVSRTPTPSPSTVKRQKSMRKPPPTHTHTETQREEGVKEGYTLTVLGSSNPHLDVPVRRASLDVPPRSQSQSQSQSSTNLNAEMLSRNGSVRSAASAPVGAAALGQKKVNVRKVSASASASGKGKGKVMASLGEVGDRLVVGYSGQVVGPSTSTGMVKTGQVKVGMEVPRAPPRVGEVLEREERKEGVVDGLREVRAPGSVFGRVEGLPVVLDPGPVFGAAGGGEPSRVRGGSGRESPVLSVVSGRALEEGTGTGLRTEMGRKTMRPAVSPLRSALRNQSRMPSPSPLPGAQVAAPQAQSGNEENERGRSLGAVVHSLSLSPSPTPTLVPTLPARSGRPVQMDDSGTSSDSGDEIFFEADDGTQENHDDSHRDSGSASAQQNGTAVGAEEVSVPAPSSEPRRRKSVRVSLNPTFSATPPAIDYDDKEPWASGSGSGSGSGNRWANGGAEGCMSGSARSTWGRNGKEKEVGDLWEDSSEEDVEYARARRMLSRLGGAGRKEVRA